MRIMVGASLFQGFTILPPLFRGLAPTAKLRRHFVANENRNIQTDASD